jgi:hypothetical protein
MIDFLKILIGFFDSNKIPYMLSGSVAMSTYTVPRFTRDFDFVVHLKQSDIINLMKEFKEGYYCNEDAVRQAINEKGKFNIIDHKSGYKADFLILKDEPYRQEEFSRKRVIDFLELKLYVVSVEDLLLSKLIWIQDVQSSLQMEDIRQLASLPDLDQVYIQRWLKTLKLNTFNLLNE